MHMSFIGQEIYDIKKAFIINFFFGVRILSSVRILSIIGIVIKPNRFLTNGQRRMKFYETQSQSNRS